MRLETERLVLRPFQMRDVNAFAAINADTEVMRFFPKPRSRVETEANLDSFAAGWVENGYGFSAIEQKSDGLLLGMCGLSLFKDDRLQFTPCTEIGWRLRADYWGQGIATEAAGAWLRWGFEHLRLNEIVAFTPVINHPSQRLMRRLNMQRAPEMDFDLPGLDEDHPLRPMAFSRMTRPQWQQHMQQT